MPSARQMLRTHSDTTSFAANTPQGLGRAVSHVRKARIRCAAVVVGTEKRLNVAPWARARRANTSPRLTLHARHGSATNGT